MRSALSAVPLSTPGLWLTGLERGFLLAGLALALGGLAGRAVARNYKETPPAPLPEPWVIQGCLIGLAAAAALIITALVDPALATNLARPLVAGPRGAATLVIASLEFACFTVAAVLLKLGKSGPVTQLLLGVVFVESLRSHPEGLLPLAGALLTICHLLPAVVWAGMLVYTLRAALAWRSDPVAMQALIKLYGSAAAWLFGTVVATGVLSAVLLVPLGSLLTTDYGRFLIVKAALVAVVAGLAIAGRAALHRRAEAGAGPALVTKVECGMLAAVLLVTGLLTVITPPPRGIFATTHAASHAGHVRGGPRGSSPFGQHRHQERARRGGHSDLDEVDCLVTGTASDLYLALWNRRPTTSLRVQGDASVLRLFSDTVKIRWT